MRPLSGAQEEPLWEPNLHMAAEPREGWQVLGGAYEGYKRPVMIDRDQRGDDEHAT